MPHPIPPTVHPRRAALPLASLLPLPLLLAACGDRQEDAARGEGGGWGVVVGVSRYEHFPPLQGGAAQAERMLEVFQRMWGIPRGHLRLLLDTAATRQAIRSALVEWLPSVVAPGDTVEPGAGETLRAALVLSRCGSRQEAVGR